MEECNKIYQNSNNFNHANPETLHKENKDKKHPLTRTIQIAPNNPASNPRQHEAPISPPPKKEPPKKKKTLNITFPNTRQKRQTNVPGQLRSAPPAYCHQRQINAKYK